MDIPIPHAEAVSPDAVAGLLQAAGRCDARTLERGRRVAAESGQRLDRVLIQLGLVSERELATSYAELLGCAVAGPERYPAEPLFAERLLARFLRHARAMPIEATADAVTVAMADPLDVFTPGAIAAATGCAVRIAVAVPIELEAAFVRLYPDPSAAAAAEEVEDTQTEASEDDADRLKDMASEAPVIRLVNQLIARAVETQASDIHIEPFEDRLRVRYRNDGVLREAESPPTHMIPAIISRLKIMARLDIAERRLPQDGRIKLAVRGHEVDFRVSTIPSLHGETVVLRVLDRSAVVFDYARLGLPASVVERLEEAFALPNGIVLVTGPTGSGKTTTLYTGLTHLNAVTRKVVTVEDPIEYQLGGINQIQVKPQIGLSFATLLRSILRQDPGRHHGGRNPRPRDGADRGAGGAHRPLGVVDAAHQLRRRNHHPAARHGAGGLLADGRVARGAGAAAGTLPMPGLPGGGARTDGGGAAVRAGPAVRLGQPDAVAPGWLPALPWQRVPRAAGDRGIPGTHPGD